MCNNVNNNNIYFPSHSILRTVVLILINYKANRDKIRPITNMDKITKKT